MAKIPSFKSSTISSDVTGANINPSSFGNSAQAVASLGGAAAQFATRLLAQRTAAKNQAFVSNSILQAQVDTSRLIQDLKTNVPRDENGGISISKVFREKLEEGFKAIQDQAPSETARAQFEQRFRSQIAARSIIGVEQIENQLQVQEIKTNTEASVRAKANFQLDFPNFKDAIKDVESVENEIKNIQSSARVFNEFEEENLIQAAGQILEASLEGELASNNPIGVLQILQGGGEISDDNAQVDFSKVTLSPEQIKEILQDPEQINQLLDLSDNLTQSLLERAAKSNSPVTIFTGSGLGFDQGIDVVSNRSIIDRFIDTKTKSNFIKRALRLASSQKSRNTSIIRAQISDFEASLLSGDKVPESELNGLITRIRSNFTKKDEAATLISRLVAAKATGSTLSKFATTNPSRWEGLRNSVKRDIDKFVKDELEKNPELQDSLGTKQFSSRIIKSAERLLDRQKKGVLKLRDKDPGRLVIDNNPGLNRSLNRGIRSGDATLAVSNILQEQRRLGILSPKPLPNGVAQSFAASISGNLNNLAQASAQLRNINDVFGRFSKSVQRQLVATGSLDAEVFLVNLADDEPTRQEFIGAINKSDDISKSLQNNPGFKSIAREVDESISIEIDKIRQALSRADRFGSGVAFGNSIQSVTKKIALSRLIADPNLDPNEVVKDIVERRLPGKIVEIENSVLFIPKKTDSGIDLDTDLISESIENLSDEDNIANLDLSIDPQVQTPTLSGRLPLADNESVQSQKEELADFIEDNGRWSMTDDGVILEVVDDRGIAQPVRDSKGQFLKITWEELMTGQFK